MLRKIAYSLLSAGMLFSANTLATTYGLGSGFSVDVELPADGAMQKFKNYSFWETKADCKISKSNPNTPISITALSNSGAINGTKLSEGENLTITVNQGDIIHIVAAARAEVGLSNRGSQTVKGTCTTK